MDNKYSVYRNIRYQRTYRTLGRMSLWRFFLGAALIIYVLLLSGIVSQIFAGRGGFRMAEKLMVSPEWMEKYKPETKAFIEAGVLYQDGELEEAAEAFEAIGDFDAAATMHSLVSLELALQAYENGDFDVAYDRLGAVETGLLDEDNVLKHYGLCQSLYGHYSASGDNARCDALQTLLDAHKEA